jgi:transcriptional regulator with XRE-family HTH domain
MTAAGYARTADLVRATGIGDAVISRWLRGETTPDIPNLRRLSKALKIPPLVLAVAAGHFSPKEAQMRELPKPPEPVYADPVEREIREARYPQEITDMLLEMLAANREQIRRVIESLRASGALNGHSHNPA